MNWLIWVIAVFIPLSAYRLVRGPELQDRLMGLGLVSSQIIVLMCIVAVEYGRSFYLDAAILYALLSFSEVVAFVRFAPRKGRDQ